MDPVTLAALPVTVLPSGLRAIHVPPARPDRSTVLLLHGWVMNRSAWAEAASPLLARGHGLLLPDLPGHGDSDELPPGLRPDEIFHAIAVRLEALLDALGLDAVDVAGYSMGTTAAMALADAAPARVRRLFLLSPVCRPPVVQFFHAHRAVKVRLARNLGRVLRSRRRTALLHSIPALVTHGAPFPRRLRHWSVRAGLSLGHLPRKSEFNTYVGLAGLSEVEVFLEGVAKTSLRETARYLAAAPARRYEDALRRYPGPVTFATCDLDALSPVKFVEALARRTRPGHERTVAVIEGADHVALSQAPADVAGLLTRWLSATEGRAA